MYGYLRSRVSMYIRSVAWGSTIAVLVAEGRARVGVADAATRLTVLGSWRRSDRHIMWRSSSRVELALAVSLDSAQVSVCTEFSDMFSESQYKFSAVRVRPRTHSYTCACRRLHGRLVEPPCVSV